MDTDYYLSLFQSAADELDKKLVDEKQLKIAVGLYGESVFLKLYKATWANPSPDLLTSRSRIFFSVWIDDATIKKQRISYNIHALKLRHLDGYKIESRRFAAAFREKFDDHMGQWPNVSVDFGPLTLMEGWVHIDDKSIQQEIIKLSRQFLTIEYLIDSVLREFKK